MQNRPILRLQRVRFELRKPKKVLPTWFEQVTSRMTERFSLALFQLSYRSFPVNKAID